MALQPSITEYFATRKRPAIDDAKRSSQPSKKVMILENADGDVSIRKLADERLNAPKIPSAARRKLIYPNRPSNVVSASEANVTKKKVLRRVLFDKKASSSPQPDIRKTFGVLNGKSSSTLKAKETSETCSNNEVVIGNDEMKIAPKDEPVKSLEKSDVEKSSIETTQVKGTSVEQTTEDDSKVEVAQPALEITVAEKLAVEKSETESLALNSETSLPKSSVPVDSGKSSVTPTEVGESGTRNATTHKDVNLEKLKSRIQKSSKLNELKASLAKLNNGFANLEKIQKEKKNFSAKAQLDKFDMITFETTVPSPSKKTPIKMGMSPGKLREAAFGSPAGRRRLDLDSAAPVAAPFVSPRKLLDSAAPLPPPSSTPPPSSPLKSPLKSPAFQRYQALVSEGKSALTLPFKYRSLAEVFRAVETVVSMLEKRQETTTFTKLKSSVQELLRRNLFEKHLAQIRSVNDAFYTFQYEKVHAVGSSKLQPDRYELVVKPVLGGLGTNMSPDVLLERRRQFYNCLLEKTKVYHEQFLATLDPPLVVPRESLTRWHPEFDVDSVPDIEAAALPEPPCSSKVSTAKDVLEKARNLFTSNPRMERALQKVSEQQSTLAEPAATTATTNTGPAVAALTTALKGIPKSLLEKVRAKQAARALEAMTRSPSQAKEAIRLTRLPEIARIVRNTFISEKKCVLTRELVLKKLSNSYREALSFQELDSHLNLLQEKSPEWLNFCTFRKTDYVRFVKDADMLKVMAKLEALANQNSY